MTSKFPGAITTWRLMNDHPTELFQKIGTGRELKIHRHGLRRFAVLTEPEHFKHVLQTHADRYKKGPALTRVWRGYLGDGLLTSHGQRWRSQRKSIAPAFQAKNISGYTSIIERHTDEMLVRWREVAAKNASLNMGKEMSELSLKILCSSLFSETIKNSEITDIVETLDGIRSETRFSDIIGLSDYLPRVEKPSRRTAILSLNRTMRDIILRRRKSKSSYSDLLDHLLNARNLETGKQLTKAELVDELKTLFIAGYETTAVLLTWAFYLLAISKGHDERLAKEISARSPENKQKTMASADHPAVEKFLLEVLRLYPPVPVLSRQAIVDDYIDGIAIPKGTHIDLNLWLVHRHSNFWDNPNLFDMNRFDPEKIAKQHKYAYMPFGAGPRVCIGKAFALQEAALIMEKVVEEFRFEYQEKAQPIPVGSFVLKPNNSIPLYPILR